MDLCRNVSEINGDFSRKSEIFPAPVSLALPGGFRLELGTGAGAKKLE